jgi:hypothetical protein
MILPVSVTHSTPSFMSNCASFISENRHLDVLDALVKLGHDFNDTPSPHFESWPKPCPEEQEITIYISITPEDPFFIEYLRIIVRTNQGESWDGCRNKSVLNSDL